MALNNHLFEQMERLNDDSLTNEQLQHEVTRTKSMAAISKEIITNAQLSLSAERFKAEYGGKRSVELPKMLE